MADSPSLNPEPEISFSLSLVKAQYAILEAQYTILAALYQYGFEKALLNLSLANLETTVSSLDLHRSYLIPFIPIPFLPRRNIYRSAAPSEEIRICDGFGLSATPDCFVRTDFWSNQDQDHMCSTEKNHGDIIQRLEYIDEDGTKNGDNDGLPEYIFQLGRLILPLDTYSIIFKLPFMAVVDVLDPLKSVWLLHVWEIAEDPEEGREWYPPQYVLNEFACLFDESNRREPAYHIAQVAPSLEEWMVQDWDTTMENIKRTRRRVNLEIKPAWEATFKLATDEARNNLALCEEL